MAARQVPNLSFEETRKSLNVFFKQQLDSLGLSVESLKQQTEKELRRSAIVIDQAIENHESFGKLAVSIEAEGAVVVVTRKTESHFEIGILPLLLERKQIILCRLSECDTKNSILELNFETRNLNIRPLAKVIT